MKRCLILAYHRVNSSGKDPIAVSTDSFRTQLKYFYENGFSSMTLEEFVCAATQKKLPQKTLVITFDDGYRDNYLFAFPVMRLYGFRGTFFLTTDYIGTDDIFPMDKKKNWDYVTDEDLPLTWEQVFEMKEHGMEFGSHTCSHRFLDELPEEDVIREVIESKRYLEQKLQSRVASFCYPAGRFNDRVKEIVRQAGYVAAVVTPRHAQISEDLYSIKRIGIYSGDSVRRFRFKTSRFFRVVRDLGLVYQLKKITLARFKPD